MYEAVRTYLILLGYLLVGPMLVALGRTVSAADPLYFPTSDQAWKKVDPAAAGWDKQRLEAALRLAGERNSSGVVVLSKGRIMAERYWELPNPPLLYKAVVRGTDSAGHVIEDVASAQKSIVAVLVGMAQERRHLSIDDPVSKYLGVRWSKTNQQQESSITIRHMISMTSGLATDLTFEAEPGSKWRYNTPAYHQLMPILEKATGMDRHQLTRQWITEPLGMTHSSWVRRPGGRKAAYGFATTARDLSRFGLMVQVDGRWNKKSIIGDKAYLRAMLAPSQDLNRAYGYLWWLNGHDYTTPGLAGRRRSRGHLIPMAPKDLVAMQGALDRKLYLVPSLDLVVTRLGASGRKPGKNFNHGFWEALVQAAPAP